MATLTCRSMSYYESDYRGYYLWGHQLQQICFNFIKSIKSNTKFRLLNLSTRRSASVKFNSDFKLFRLFISFYRNAAKEEFSGVMNQNESAD